MKKFLALFTAVMMVFGMAASLAEPIQWTEAIPGYEVTLTLPEGAQTALDQDEDWVWLRITFPGTQGESPVYDLTIAPSEECEGRSMSELTKDEWDNLIALLSENALEPKYNISQLPDGNALLVVEEDTEVNDFAVMETIYNGYFVCLYARYEDYNKLSQEDMDMMKQIMTECLSVKEIQ